MANKPRRRSVPAKPTTGSKTRTYLIGGVVGIAIIGLLALLALSLQGPGQIEGIVDRGVQNRGHDNSVVFEDTGLPPAGGIHADRWQRCGIYDDPITTANAVHSLEHGAVWVTYQPGLAEDEVTALKNTVRGENFVLLSPFPGQRSEIVLTAWQYQLEVDNAADERIEAFLDKYIQGPQTPEPGATCGGPSAVGNPTG